MNETQEHNACDTHSLNTADEKQFSRNELVYVIDDEPVITQLIAHYFAEDGFKNVAQLNEAVEIMDTLESRAPDLLVMDLMMPDVSGRFLMHKIENDPKFESVPIIVVSAEKDPGVAEETLHAGALDFLCKPVDPIALLRKAKRALANKRQLDGLEKKTKIARAELRAIRVKACRSQEKHLRQTLRNTLS